MKIKFQLLFITGMVVLSYSCKSTKKTVAKSNVSKCPVWVSN